MELIKGSQGEETNAQDVGPMDPAKEMATHTVAGKNNIRPVGSTGKHSSNAVLQEEGYSDYNFWKIPLPVIEDI